MKRTLLSYIFFIFSVFAMAAAENSQLRFNHFTVEDGLSQNTILTIAKDKYGFMWFGTWEGVCRFDGYTFRVFRADEDNPRALSNNRINSIFTEKDGSLWVETADASCLFRYNYSDESFSRISTDKLPKSVGLQLEKIQQQGQKFAQNRSTRWEATKNGLLQTNLQTGVKSLYLPDEKLPYSLTDNGINAVYLDDCHNLWVGTQNGGVNVANLNSKPFNYYPIGMGITSDKVVRAVCQDQKGRLWVGTETNGICVIDRNAANKVTWIAKNRLINPNVRHLYCDKAGNIWVGTKGGLDRITPDGSIHHYYAGKAGSIRNPWVFWVTEDSDGRLWVATFAGIAQYLPQSDSFRCIDPAQTLRNASVRVIMEDYRKNLWVATEGGGVSRLQRTGKSSPEFVARHYVHISGNSNSLINDLVLTMTEDEDHKIWIGTNSGLCRLDPTTDQFVRFSVSNGFPDDLIMGLLADRKGHIWVSHKKGLTCMDIRNFSSRTYNRYDGLQGNEFTQNAFYRNQATGELFFGGTNGLNAFFPDKIASAHQPLRVVFTGLKIMNQAVEPGVVYNGRVVLPQSLLSTNKLVLSWEDMNFSIGFSSLNYGNPYGCRYRYRLLELDKDWIYTDAASHEATFSHLPAGSYTLSVEVANADGQWSGRPAMLKIEILPPWWWAWWTKLIYFAVLLLIVWLVFRYLRERMELRNKLLLEQVKAEKNEELTNMKLQFFTEISHEFRTPLTLIIDPLEQLLEGKTDVEQTRYYHQLMNRNAKQLLELINQLLDFRKLQSGSLAPKFVSADLVAFVRNVLNSFEHRAMEQQITLSFQSGADAIGADFDPDKMQKILNNLIANALKFTPTFGKISVRLQELESDVLIVVEDTGKGIGAEHQAHIFEAFYQVEGASASTQGSGIGLALTKELVTMHGGSISVESEPGQGACFRIRIPRHQSEVEDSWVESAPTIDRKEETPSPEQPLNDQDGLPLLLIVDDNEDIRDYIRINFASQYRIITANDGLDGFNKAVEYIPEIIISDIMMPGVDGIEFCSRIKSDEHTSHIPVILLTARQSDESRVEGYETGADAYITKPFSKKVLETRLINLLQQRRKLRELFGDGSAVEIKRVAVNVTDEAFLNRVMQVLNENMQSSTFDQEQLAELLHMSQSQLYRKIKAMTNRSVHDFIVTLRMNKARELLLAGELSIAEVGYQVGYSQPTNFTRTFTKQFGVGPSKYLEKHKQ